MQLSIRHLQHIFGKYIGLLGGRFLFSAQKHFLEQNFIRTIAKHCQLVHANTDETVVDLKANTAVYAAGCYLTDLH